MMRGKIANTNYESKIATLTTALSFGITSLMRKIPGLKKVI